MENLRSERAKLLEALLKDKFCRKPVKIWKGYKFTQTTVWPHNDAGKLHAAVHARPETRPRLDFRTHKHVFPLSLMKSGSYYV